MDLKLVKRNKVFHGRVFDVIVDDLLYPSGVPTIREVAEHPGGAVIVPVFDDGRVILIRQHRYPLGEFIRELPAGKLDRGEEPLACAKRELMEETGYSALRWDKLNAIFTTPGFCTEVLHIFLARGLNGDPSDRMLEPGEETMTMEMLPLAEAGRMVDRGEIRDGKSICGILQAIRRIADE